MRDKLHAVPDTGDVEPWRCPVARIDAYGFQSRQLLEEAPVFLEVNHSVKLYIVAAPGEHSMLMDKLLSAYAVFGLSQVCQFVR